MLHDMPMSKPRHFKPIQKNWYAYIQQLFPCVLCQMERSAYAGLCADCWNNLPWALTQIQRSELNIHIACYYEYPLNSMMLHYKYHQQLVYKSLFVQLLLQLNLPKVQAVVAMPISTQRLAERGFNQVLELAKAFAKLKNIPVWQPVIRKNAQHQKGLSRAERLVNIDEQFHIIKSEYGKYQQILVLDDVVTTGNSLHALQTALRQLGCKQLHFACVAGAIS